jgi:hypothetical protein
MKAILPLCLLVCVPQVSSAQINSISPPVCNLTPDRRVIAEVVGVERHAEGDVKYSVLQVVSVFGNGDFRAMTEPKTMKVRHAHRDFELFEGQHVLDLKRTHCRGEWYLERSSHGEVVDAAERAAKPQRQESWENMEQQRCFGIIDRAYALTFHPWTDAGRVPNECRKFRADYLNQFRVASK